MKFVHFESKTFGQYCKVGKWLCASYEFADGSCALILSYVNFTPRGFTSIPEFFTFNLLSPSLYFKSFLNLNQVLMPDKRKMQEHFSVDSKNCKPRKVTKS